MTSLAAGSFLVRRDEHPRAHVPGTPSKSPIYLNVFDVSLNSTAGAFIRGSCQPPYFRTNGTIFSKMHTFLNHFVNENVLDLVHVD